MARNSAHVRSLLATPSALFPVDGFCYARRPPRHRVADGEEEIILFAEEFGVTRIAAVYWILDILL